MIDDVFYPYLVSIDSNGYAFCSDGHRHSGYYFTKRELLGLKNAIEKSLELYEKEGIDDAYIIQADKKATEEQILLWKNQTKTTKSKKKDSLYLILDKSRNALKIGRSINPKSRLKQLRTSNCGELVLLFDIKDKGFMEEEVHNRFNHLRLSGEWFSNDMSIVEYFQNKI